MNIHSCFHQCRTYRTSCNMGLSADSYRSENQYSRRPWWLQNDQWCLGSTCFFLQNWQQAFPLLCMSFVTCFISIIAWMFIQWCLEVVFFLYLLVKSKSNPEEPDWFSLNAALYLHILISNIVHLDLKPSIGSDSGSVLTCLPASPSNWSTWSTSNSLSLFQQS